MKTVYNICLITLSMTLALTLASCKAGGGSKSTGDSIGPLEIESSDIGHSIAESITSGEGIIFVDEAKGSDTGYGTMTSPYRTVKKGIQAASAMVSGSSDIVSYKVYIAQGTYTVESEGGNINMLEGISIYGGFANNNGEWTRESTSYTTSIQNVVAGSGITSATVIDGFSISGKASTNAVAIFCFGGSPVISYNTINGAPVLAPYSLIKTAVSIHLINSSAVISNNIIIGGISDRESDGILCQDSSPRITGNSIEGGKSMNSYCIKSLGTSDPVVNTNTLSSSGMTGRSGIVVGKDSANPAEMINNTFTSSLSSSDISDEITLFLIIQNMKEFDSISSINDFSFASGNM